MNIILKDQNGRRLRLFGARLTPAHPAATLHNGRQELTLHLEETDQIAPMDPVFLVVADDTAPPPHDGYGLTQAERAVALAIAAGTRPEDIAQLRGTSINTVRNQIRAAMEKCNVSRQIDLARVMLGSDR